MKDNPVQTYINQIHAQDKLNKIHECAATTLNELPHYPCEPKEMTDRELKIVEICTVLCGTLAWIERFSKSK